MFQVFASPRASHGCRWAVGVWAALVLAGPVFGQTVKKGGRAGTPSVPPAAPVRFTGPVHPQRRLRLLCRVSGSRRPPCGLAEVGRLQGPERDDPRRPPGRPGGAGHRRRLGAAKGGGPKGAEVVAKAQLFVRRGAAVGIRMEGPGKAHIVAVFRGGSGPDLRGLLDALAASMGAPKGIKADLRKGSRR